MLVGGKVQLINVQGRGTEVLRLTVQDEVMQVAAIVHGQGSRRVWKACVDDIKDSPAKEICLKSTSEFWSRTARCVLTSNHLPLLHSTEHASMAQL